MVRSQTRGRCWIVNYWSDIRYADAGMMLCIYTFRFTTVFILFKDLRWINYKLSAEFLQIHICYHRTASLSLTVATILLTAAAESSSPLGCSTIVTPRYFSWNTIPSRRVSRVSVQFSGSSANEKNTNDSFVHQNTTNVCTRRGRQGEKHHSVKKRIDTDLNDSSWPCY